MKSFLTSLKVRLFRPTNASNYGNDNVSRSRSGPPPQIIAQERDKLYDLIKHGDTYITIRDLLRYVGTYI